MPVTARAATVAAVLVLGTALAACSGGSGAERATTTPAAAPVTTPATTPERPATTTTRATTTTTTTARTTTIATTTTAPPGPVRPAWLGTRALAVTDAGFGEVGPTPPELIDRRFPPPADQAAPADPAFTTTVEPPTDAVIARSTWGPDCPVDRSDLRHLRLSYWGFDDRPHVGELLVHADVADDVAGVFSALYAGALPDRGDAHRHDGRPRRAAHR